jgi:DnaJ-class molecular chaperone
MSDPKPKLRPLCPVCDGKGRIILSPGEGAACDACDGTGYAPEPEARP